MSGDGNDYNNHPPVPFPRWDEDSRLNQRLSAIESDIRSMQRDIGRLEGQYETVTTGLSEVRQELVGLGTDVKWIREALLEEVKKASARADQANGNGNVAKALGVMAILAAAIAAAIGGGVTLP